MSRPMVRHSRRAPALVAALLLAAATAACGIKGPLVSAPKPDATKDTAKPPAPSKP